MDTSRACLVALMGIIVMLIGDVAPCGFLRRGHLVSDGLLVLICQIAVDGRLLQDEETQRPAPLHASHPTAQACAAGAPAPGKRSQLVLFRARGDYGCVWTTYARRTDAPVVYRFTRITR